jgi:hypothetical protein
MISKDVDLTSKDGADPAPATGIPPMVQHCASTPQPESQLVAAKFPGKKGVLHANMIPFTIVIFRLMQQIRLHVEIGSHICKGTAKWKELFDCFFDQTDCMGRSFMLWVGNNGWKKFRKTVMAAVHGHAMAYENNSLAPSEVQVLAHELEQEFAYASSAQQTRVDTAADNEAQCQKRLATAGQSMGLTILARGVQPLTLDFELDCFQVEALEELGQNTVSPNNTFSPTGRTSRTTIAGGAAAFTPVAAGVGASAFILVAVGGKNPTGPGFPTFFAYANTTPSVANNFPLVQNFPANCGNCARDSIAVCHQSNIAAGNVGEPVVKKAGTHTRNPNQVDVLHLMNQQIMQGITHLNNLAPSAADQRRIQLKGAISSALK